MKTFKQHIEETPAYERDRDKRMGDLSAQIEKLKADVTKNPSKATIRDKKEKLSANAQRQRRAEQMGRGA